MSYTDHSGQVKTASGINIILGIWFLISAWIYGYAAASQAMVWNYVVVGALIAIFGIMRYATPHSRIGFSWVNVVLGVWALISPWIYGYAGDMPRVWNDVIVGIVVAGLAIWSGSATVSEHRHQVAA
jgi:hypothetical protein